MALIELHDLPVGCDPREFLLPAILSAKTEYGIPVRDYRLQNDHYLLYKIRSRNLTTPTEGGIPIILPDVTTGRSIGNMAAIKGMVVKVSESYRVSAVEKTMRRNPQTEKMEPHFDLTHGVLTAPVLEAGAGVIYNSYNMCKIGVVGLLEDLVLVRGIDIEASYDIVGNSEVLLEAANLPTPKVRQGTRFAI